jgi:hypothetical protein
MDNLKLPAYPCQSSLHGQQHPGLTKLEVASLMIAQGICANPAMDSNNVIPAMSVRIAKAVIEEANK